VSLPENSSEGPSTSNAEFSQAIDLDETEAISTAGAEKAAVTSKATSPKSVRVILDWANPLKSARTIIAEHYLDGGVRTLLHHNGDFYAWNRAVYQLQDDNAIRAQAYQYLDGAWALNAKGEVVAFKPNQAKVNHVLDALKAEVNLPKTVEPPIWLREGSKFPAHEIVSCRNGLLHLPSRRFLSPNPDFFNINSTEFDYLPDAGEPGHWLEFLQSLWPNDPEAINTLQEIFGYLLLPDTRQKKIFMLVGPRRSGKGTMGRLFTRLLGPRNVVSPTLGSFSSRFGLEPLIGKQLAIISDARLGRQTNQEAIAERLLNISGEDGVTIDRKFRPSWSGKLPCRFLILTNELPQVSDASGALAGRFVLLKLTQSFYGREDLGLLDRLLTELPGILNWAIEGWERLQERGHFAPLESSQDLTESLEALSSPIRTFCRDWCTVGPEQRVVCFDLYKHWLRFCEKQGINRPGSIQVFGRDLQAAMPSVKTLNLRDGDKRIRWYSGISFEG